MEVRANATVVIILRYMSVSNQHVHLKTYTVRQCQLYLNKAEKKGNTSILSL